MSLEFLGGSGVVTAVVWVQSLAWELLHAAGAGCGGGGGDGRLFGESWESFGSSLVEQ